MIEQITSKLLEYGLAGIVILALGTAVVYISKKFIQVIARFEKYMKKVIDNHLTHIEKNTEITVEQNEKHEEQHRELINVNENMHKVLKDIHKEVKE